MPIRVIENVFVPLTDGTRLAARIWLRGTAEAEPAPAILEYIPYRKRDGTRGRDEPMHHWFAEAGYAAIRVDMRGSGDSDGLLDDEYLMQEQDDAIEVIAWIAAQAWCTGAVGMMGKSWGGFNALQVAARRPPALKAIVTVCSTDDRYADDIHYMGACLLNDNLWWGTIMLAYQARPADPAIVGTGWRKQWIERLEHVPFWPALWMPHQRRDDYWRHGSVCEDFSAITCPVLAIGGWADAYTNAIPRLLEGLDVPRQAIIGPWAHVYPQDGTPGPAIGFLQECAQFWDRWLKGLPNGHDDGPMLRAFVEHERPAGAWVDPVPGRWIAESIWPSPRIRPQVLHIASTGLAATADATAELQIRSPLWCGSTAGEWMGSGIAGEQPTDQRLDDGFSLVFDTAKLEERMTILGAPEAVLQIASDKPVAQVCVRLCDAAPDGSSRRVSYQVLNLTHRDSHAEPTPLEPGRFYEVRLKLNDCAQTFEPGHRIRLAVSSAWWPLVWPSPEAATLTLRTGASRLVLPVRPDDPADAEVRFEPPARGPHAPVTRVATGRTERHATFDLQNGRARYVTIGEGGVFDEGVLRFDEIDTVLFHGLTRDLVIGADDPATADYRLTQAYEMGRDGWRIRIETETRMTATADTFRLEGRLVASENGATVVERAWDQSFARDLV